MKDSTNYFIEWNYTYLILVLLLFGTIHWKDFFNKILFGLTVIQRIKDRVFLGCRTDLEIH